MKPGILLSLLLALATLDGLAQRLEVDHNFWRTHVYQDGERLTYKEVREAVAGDPAAHRVMRSSHRLRLVTAGLMGVATVCYLLPNLTYEDPLNYDPAAYDRDLRLLATGLVFNLAAIPVALASSKKYRKAVGVYNDHLSTGLRAPRPELYVGFDGRGLGMGLRF